jgi:dTDP-4-dehydrorhamnose 3,5-epimerase
MIFTETKLTGAFLIEPEKSEDDRGFFALTWSQHIFAERGLESRQVECNISFNRKSGTLRGMHYQARPHEQVKLVRCTAGAIFDCIIDLRPSSPTFKDWMAKELTAENRLMLYVPIGFAHGFQTLRDGSEVFYQMSERYVPESGRGVRWNDPAFGISWPRPISVIAQRDRTYPDFVASDEQDLENQA